MSSAILCQSGYTALLDAFTSGLSATLRLYTNDPDLTAVLSPGDFVEAVFQGYAPVRLTKWTHASLRDGRAFSTADSARFTLATGATALPVQGCFVTDIGTGAVLFSWRRPGGAFAFSPGVNSLVVLVSLLLSPQSGTILMSASAARRVEEGEG